MEGSINNLRDKLKFNSYKKYHNKKVKLQTKYPEYKIHNSEDYKLYIKELAGLLLQGKEFQEFIWDIRSTVDKEKCERIAKGKKLYDYSY